MANCIKLKLPGLGERDVQLTKRQYANTNTTTSTTAITVNTSNSNNNATAMTTVTTTPKETKRNFSRNFEERM